jgi:multiple sugar transport system substrate-binding protein
MMHLNNTRFAVLGVASAIVLSACSSGGTDTDPTGAPAGGSDPTKITVWHYWDGNNADAFDALVAEFNSSQSDVVVSSSNLPNAEFLTKLRASTSSGTLPDIAIGDLVWVPQINQLGSLADLSTLMDTAVVDNITDALTSYGSIDDKLVSVPVSANNLGYLYNKDLFVQAGLDPEDPPTTWEQLKEDGAVIRDATGQSAYELFTQAGDNGEGLTWQFQVNLWQAGGEFLTSDNSAAAFNTAAGETALQYWIDLIDAGIAAPSGPWGEFGKGAAASATDGSWMVGIWAPDPPFDFGASSAPYPEDGVPATNLGGEQAMVFNNSDEAAAASAEFLNWFLSDAQVLAWSEATGMLPVTQSVATSDEYLSWVDSNQPRLRPFVEQMAIAHARPNTALYPAISLAFAQQIEKALAGSVSASEALANAEEAVNTVIAEGN